MGRRKRRRRHREALASAMPSCAGNIEMNEASAMLLYEAPSGIAIFSFDGACLNNSVKDFWADIPLLSLEFFLKYERVSTSIDLANEAIDDHLAQKLTRLCGSEKKLVVGSAQHKTIIEKELGITCLYVEVPDFEVINYTLKNPMRTLLPEEKSETNKRDRLPIGKELITFLQKYVSDVKPEMVNEPIAELAHLLHDVELYETEHLKFFRILLNDFIFKSGIDTKNWELFEFATVPKMVCFPGSSYEVYHPRLIFSCDEYRKIETNASGYKTSFSKIGALSVYDDVVSLYSRKCLLLHDLDSLIEKARDAVEEKQTENVDDFKENKQDGDTGDDMKKLTASTPGQLEKKQNGHTGPLLEKMNLPEKRDTGVQGADGDKTNPASSDVPNSRQLKGQHTDTSANEKNPPEISGDDANNNKARDDTKIPETTGGIPESGQLKDQHIGTSVTKPEIIGDDEKNEQGSDAGVQSIDVNKTIPEITTDDEKDEQARAAGVQSTSGDKMNPASGEIPNSVQLKDLIKADMERERKEAGSKNWRLSFRWPVSSGDASSVRSQSSNAGMSSRAKTSHGNVGRRSKATKHTCMPFICCYPVR